MRPDEIKRAHRRWCADRCTRGPRFAIRARRGDPDEEPPDDAEVARLDGIDGIRTEDERARLDPEDDALLLRAYQLLRGQLRGQASHV